MFKKPQTNNGISLGEWGKNGPVGGEIHRIEMSHGRFGCGFILLGDGAVSSSLEIAAIPHFWETKVPANLPSCWAEQESTINNPAPEPFSLQNSGCNDQKAIR